MSTPIFRFAPSPNGFLHIGHAYSALLNQKMAEEAGGRLLLRIEDTDQTRSRPEFVNAIFEDLAWLGIGWEEPVRIQSEHFADYAGNLERLWAKGAVYPCFCSRKLAQANALASHDPDGQQHYGGTCRNLPREDARRRIADRVAHGWRLDTSGDPQAAGWGDVMISRPLVGSSYHIAVVTDDALQAVTHIVRGRDIEAATPVHMLLQKFLGYPVPCYLHHDLILDDAGEKLSKSRNSRSLRMLRAEGITARDIRKRLGFA